MSKHTPGSWRYTDGGIIDNSPERGHAGTEIADVYGVGMYDNRGPRGDVGERMEQAEANARLIAAAPEMYELLEEILGEELVSFSADERGQALIAKIERGEPKA